MLTSLRQRARAIKRDTLALYLAARHPDTPWYAKALAVLIVGYALSPIDLIQISSRSSATPTTL